MKSIFLFDSNYICLDENSGFLLRMFSFQKRLETLLKHQKSRFWRILKCIQKYFISLHFCLINPVLKTHTDNNKCTIQNSVYCFKDINLFLLFSQHFAMFLFTVKQRENIENHQILWMCTSTEATQKWNSIYSFYSTPCGGGLFSIATQQTKSFTWTLQYSCTTRCQTDSSVGSSHRELSNDRRDRFALAKTWEKEI